MVTVHQAIALCSLIVKSLARAVRFLATASARCGECQYERAERSVFDEAVRNQGIVLRGAVVTVDLQQHALVVSDRIPVSSRTLLIDCAQVGRAPRFVRERTHLVDEVWFVTHQAEQRRSRAQRARRDRVVHVLHAHGPHTGG